MAIICRCLVILYYLVFFCFSWTGISNAKSSLTAGQVMTNYQFLDSPNKRFRLQFFNPAYTSEHYLGIQIMEFNKNIIWVANRENPLMDTSGLFNITQDGSMVISDSKGTSITLNSNMSNSSSSNTSVTLLNSGNLVLIAGNQTVWQSFDYLTDTLLPGMKLGLFRLKTGKLQNYFLTSWINPDSPSAGAYTLGVDPNNSKQLTLWKSGVIYWRSGTWNGEYFDYTVFLGGSSFHISYLSNGNESYFTFSQTRDARAVMLRVISTWILELDQAETSDSWTATPFPTCTAEIKYNSQGCVLADPSNCKSGDDFSLTRGVMHQWDHWENSNLSLSDCHDICRNNCSCTAYFSLQFDGTGCIFSHQQKVYFQDRPDAESFYIRSTIIAHKGSPWKRLLLTIGIPVVSLVVLSLLFLLCYLRRINNCCLRDDKRRNTQGDTEQIMNELGASLAIDRLSGSHKVDLTGKKDHELPLFDFSSIQVVTDDCSDENKLGQGGFDPVFKGKLVDGQEIAVKRLSRMSGQGSEEFENEVILISKLQHRNLVRVLGCCIQGEERILIYEYLPNKSLDYFLFDATKRALLNWNQRMYIIDGIAQGLLYLHNYSRLKIIHRDLKTSNILLDSNMNPKISDFGTAIIFGKDESLANTNKIVSTYGYMSPEYAMDSLLSVKSDVFSFGVMMLEIVSGRKNIGFYHSNRSFNLLGYAWDLWKEERCLEMMDEELLDKTCSSDDVRRCVQVGLLCVQEIAADRPTMSDVLSMLSNELGTLPTPKQPTFSTIFSVDDKLN